MSKYSKYRFSDTEYLAAHGKAPRGRGEWAFEIDGEHKMPVAYYTGRSYGTTVTVFFIPGSLSLTEAKKQAAALLKALDIPATTVRVAP